MNWLKCNWRAIAYISTLLCTIVATVNGLVSSRLAGEQASIARSTARPAVTARIIGAEYDRKYVRLEVEIKNVGQSSAYISQVAMVFNKDIRDRLLECMSIDVLHANQPRREVLVVSRNLVVDNRYLDIVRSLQAMKNPEFIVTYGSTIIDREQFVELFRGDRINWEDRSWVGIRN